MRKLSVVWLGLLLSACAVGPSTRETPMVFDFGPPVAQTTEAKIIRASVMLQGFTAPAWLDTMALGYRLAYQEPARQRAYANSRWAGTPAALLTQRLRARLAAASEGGVIAGGGVRADYLLQLELDEFSHVFDTAERSRGLLVVRATLVSQARHALIAQRTFTIERNAASADAIGGIHALVAASDALMEALVAWTATAAVPPIR